MKVAFISICFLLCSGIVTGQIVRKFYYNKQWELTTLDAATYVRLSPFDTANAYFAGNVTDMYRNGKPEMKGFYKNLSKEGEFTFYYEDGNIESQGNFKNDRRSGTWKFYHPNGQLKLEATFNASVQIVSLFDENGVQLVKDGTGKWSEVYEEYHVPGKIVVSGELKNFEKDGEWTCKFSSGELIYTEVYKKGKFIKGNVYHAGEARPSKKPHGNVLIVPYKFVVTEAFAAADSVNFSNYPFLNVMQRGDKTYSRIPNDSSNIGQVLDVVALAEIPASPPSGTAEVYKNLYRIMRYPAYARRMGIEGKVFIEFIVDTDGTLKSFSVRVSAGGGLDEEALRTFGEYAKTAKWNPGMQQGKPVKVRFIMPLSFKLG